MTINKTRHWERESQIGTHTKKPASMLKPNQINTTKQKGTQQLGKRKRRQKTSISRLHNKADYNSVEHEILLFFYIHIVCLCDRACLWEKVVVSISFSLGSRVSINGLVSLKRRNEKALVVLLNFIANKVLFQQSMRHTSYVQKLIWDSS